MAWIRLRSIFYILPLLASGAANVVKSVHEGQAVVAELLASNRVYCTGPHERRFVQTPDGSSIWLNIGSSVLVSWTSDMRSVMLLSGEALFDVKHDSSHPFRVFSGRIVAEDVGTMFVAAKTSTTTTILVAQGEIAVFDSANLGSDGRKVSTPSYTEQFRRGERVEFSNESGAQLSQSFLTDDAVARALAWKDGRVNFKDTPLEAAIAEINRYSQTQIELAPEVEQRQLSASGSYLYDDADGFAASLKHEWGLNASESEGPAGNRIILLTSPPVESNSKRN
jgi:transmembrane sensor